jgi:hypothetical protein
MHRFVAKRDNYFVDEDIRARRREWRLYELESWAREREAARDAREA